MDSNIRRNYNNEIQKFFGDRFISTDKMSRFEVMVDHFSKKFDISKEQVGDAYEKTYNLYLQGKAEKFSGYFAAVCKGMSKKEYTEEQTKRHIEFNVKERNDGQLEDFISKYDAGERRVFAPSFGITKKEHNDPAYLTAKMELEARQNKSLISAHEMKRNTHVPKEL
jgi:hypothetical protein